MPTTTDILEASYQVADSPPQPASMTIPHTAYDGCWAVSETFWQVVVDDRLAANPINRVDPQGLFSSSNHEKITKDALEGTGLTKRAIGFISGANVDQDQFPLFNIGPFSNPLNHGDNNQIAATIDLMTQRWNTIIAADPCSWDAVRGLLKRFGRIIHAVQDLYAHSTYVENYGGTTVNGGGGNAQIGQIPVWRMWTSGTPQPNVPAGVISGNYNWPFDNASSPSHAEIDKDDADTLRGRMRNAVGVSNFDLAFDLAVRHTLIMWQGLYGKLTPKSRAAFDKYAMEAKA